MGVYFCACANSYVKTKKYKFSLRLNSDISLSDIIILDGSIFDKPTLLIYSSEGCAPEKLKFYFANVNGT